MEMSKADTMNLEWEQQLIVENMSFLKYVNLFLINQLKDLQNKFKNLQAESTREIKEYKNELHLLREDIKEIENAHSFKIDIPESWIIKE